ncbi:MAG: ubiquinol-cytochrome c reductase iron-sulfur subunit [Notoacmeibacter sp.]|nr:ubiquinol-cytochrome c reductase iron-sulfur subunit [Notoacmeibacter sp.]
MTNAAVTDKQPTRRDFLYVATGTAAAIGAAFAAWPFIDNLRPSAGVRSLAAIEVSLAPIEPGQRVTIKWRGQPVFIDRRTPERVAAAVADDNAELKDPERDYDRVQDPEWLIVVGVCTHLGCIPLGQKDGDSRGEWGGWFCPCHGSAYDTSGRIRKGPAPKNLVVPTYRLIDGETVIFG